MSLDIVSRAYFDYLADALAGVKLEPAFGPDDLPEAIVLEPLLHGLVRVRLRRGTRFVGYIDLERNAICRLEGLLDRLSESDETWRASDIFRAAVDLATR